MEPHLQKTVDDLLEKLRGQEKGVVDTKRLINELCVLGGAEPMFAVTDESAAATLTTIRADTFYGQPFATAVAMYLRMRKAKDLGPATVNEIHQALLSGGYQFDAKNADYARRGIRHSLSKNTQTFHRVPNGAFGLLEWYPDIKKKPAKPMVVTSIPKDGDDEEDDDEEDDDEDGKNETDNDDKPATPPKVGLKMPPGIRIVKRNPTTKVG